jgi:hypothetical protein
MDLAAGLGDETQTDIVNRAVQVYAYLKWVSEAGGAVYIKNPDGSMERAHFFTPRIPDVP